jgi:hypothetical protein
VTKYHQPVSTWHGTHGIAAGTPRMPARVHRIYVMRFHLPVSDHVVMDLAPALYMIRVDGRLGAMTLSAFPEMTPQQKGTHTVLTGWLDQSALYGVLALGLVLLEVRQMKPHGESLESGDTGSPR